MTADTNDDWLGDPGASLVPGRKAPSRPTEADLRAQLRAAPEVPGDVSQKKEKGDERRSDERDARDGSKAGGAKGSSGRSGGGYSGTNPTGDRGGGKARGARRRGEIFDDCPVTPLGVHGDLHWFLDTNGQLRALDGSFQKNKMLSLFGGRMGLLSKRYPQYQAKSAIPKAGDFNALELATALIQATTERGVWSPVGRVRGAGAWADDDGQLIYHAGDEVLIGGEWRPPGVYDGRVYPASDPVPRPAATGARGDAGMQILDLIETWNWARPEIDPWLALGSICAQMMGGALAWRPVTWLTGDKSAGKSTYQSAVEHLHGGPRGLIKSANATEGGIRSLVGNSSMPVSLDEFEPDDDPKRGRGPAIIQLARVAASGDQVLRGSSDQKGHQSNVYCCFLFSSIYVHALTPQDQSRMIILSLKDLPEGTGKLVLDPRRLRRLGEALRRNLIDGWETWPQRLALWQSALAARGHGGRVADNFGTVMALADMGLHSELPSTDEIEGWIAKLDPHLQGEKDEAGTSADRMLEHLMSQSLDVWRRGQKYNVATWLAMAARLDKAPEQIETATSENANTFLAQFGLRVRGRGNSAALCIANKPLAGLRALFEGSTWAEGVWAQAAERVKGAEKRNMTFARVGSRANVIPFSSIPGLLNALEDSPVRAAPPSAPLGDEIEDFH